MLETFQPRLVEGIQPLSNFDKGTRTLVGRNHHQGKALIAEQVSLSWLPLLGIIPLEFLEQIGLIEIRKLDL